MTGDGPIEVWLTRKTIAITCMVVHEDERAQRFTVDSLNMRGAQREMTSSLLGQGFAPVGRWVPTVACGDETMRTFRRAT